MSAVSTVELGARGVLAPAASLGIGAGGDSGSSVVARPIGLVVGGYDGADTRVEELFGRGVPVPAQRCSPPLRLTDGRSGDIEVQLRIQPPAEHLDPEDVAVRVAVPIDAAGDCRLSFLLSESGDLAVRVLGSAAPVGQPPHPGTIDGLLAAAAARPLGWHDLIDLAAIVRCTPGRLFAALVPEPGEAASPPLEAVIAACAREPAAGRLLLSECLEALLAADPDGPAPSAVRSRIGEAIQEAAARCGERRQEQARAAMHAVAAAANALVDLEAGEQLQATWESRRMEVDAELHRLRRLQQEVESLRRVEQLLAQAGCDEADLKALDRLRSRIGDRMRDAERQLQTCQKKFLRLKDIARQESGGGSMDGVLHEAKELVELLFGGGLEERCARVYRSWQKHVEQLESLRRP